MIYPKHHFSESPHFKAPLHPEVEASMSPCVFAKVSEAALVHMREHSVDILNYLNDWLILAQSREQLWEHRDMVLRHLSQFGLRINWEKGELSPSSQYGVELGQPNSTLHRRTCSLRVELL